MYRKIIYSLRDTIQRLDFTYLVNGGFWLTVSQSASVISVLSISFVFANYVDQADYGVYKYIIALSAIFSLFSLTGISQSLVQAASQNHLPFLRTSFRASLLFGLSITFIGTASAVYYFLNNNMTLALGCIVIALFKPIINSSQLIIPYMQGVRMFSTLAKLQILRIAATTATLLPVIFFTNNIIYMVAAYFIPNAVISVSIYLLGSQKVPYLKGSPPSIYQKYMSYARHTSIRNVLTGFSYTLDKILAFHYLGATELAVYAFAIAIPEQLKGIFKNLSVLILIKFTGYNMERIKKGMLKKSLLLGSILMTLTILYIAVAPVIYNLLFPNYADSILISQIFALSFPAMVAIFPVEALKSQMHERDLHILNTSTAVVLIIAVYIGITQFGLIGLIIGRVIVRYVHCLSAFMFVYKKT
jgi:O-antigen/teichoic acid export membrane protein